MIGNDIIDRRAIRYRKEDHWERFRAKTMTRTEQEFLFQYRRDQLDIWLAWAAKESVYKLEYQRQPKRYFAPKTIQILSLEEAQGRMGTYPLQLEWNTNYIHALTWLSHKRPPEKQIVHKPKVKLDQLILSRLNYTFPEKDFSIEQEDFPKISVDQKRFWPLSKSHHGNWLAFAYSIA